MKSIQVSIEEETLKAIRRNIQVRQISGSASGYMDAAIIKIISAIEDGKKEVELKKKNK